MKTNSPLISLIFTMFVLFITPVVLAGGGPVEFKLEPNAYLNPGEQYIVHARVYDDGAYPTYCKNCKVTLMFKDPQGSDYIAQNSGATNEEGQLYAKVISKVPGKRTIYTSNITRPDGSTYVSNSSVILNYYGESSITTSSSTSTSTSTTTQGTQTSGLITPVLSLTSEYHLTNKNLTRSVKLNLSSVPNARTYTIFTREPNSNNWVEQTSGGYSTTAWVYVEPNKDYYLKAKAFSDNNGWSEFSNEVFLSKLTRQSGTIINSNTNTNTTVTTSNMHSPTAVSNEDANKQDMELNQKIASLEAKLADSEKKQNFLEQKVDDLLSFIKKLFPFFK